MKKTSLFLLFALILVLALTSNSFADWMYTGYDNPIYMYPVSSIYGSTIDFYSELDYNNNAIAYTSVYDGNNNQVSYTVDYVWAKIVFNDKYKYDYSINHDGTAAHELGHALGLPHNSSTYSIMYATNQSRTVQKPQKVDNDRIIEIYGR